MTACRPRGIPGAGAAGVTGRLRRDSGLSLIDVSLSTVLLVILALAANAYLYHSGAVNAVQRNRRAALGFANARLEELRTTNYRNVMPPAEDYRVYHVNQALTAVSGEDPNEEANINGIAMPVATRTRFVDIDGGADSYDGVRLSVSVRYRPGGEENVTLETLRCP